MTDDNIDQLRRAHDQIGRALSTLEASDVPSLRELEAAYGEMQTVVVHLIDAAVAAGAEGA